ncbi:MAG: XdhC family protein [Rhodobacter sp.]|nr:XdhC family protein [Rhodobacter sp.]
MGKFDIFDTVDALRRSGRPFCIATVVRTADVTSAKAGAKAAVTDAGEILGHLGGACVQRAVRAAGLAAIASGETQVIRVKPSDTVVALTDDDGAQVYKSGCPSGGTVDLLIEPFELPPRLVIFGTTPIARALAAHGALAGYRVVVPEALETDAEVARFDGAGLEGLDLGPRDFVVVASQGARDLACLRAAVESPARRVSMVASRRKASALTAKLAAAGVPVEKIARLKSPAGLDLKGVDPQEIAISVLAEIVAWRNADRELRSTAVGATAG